MIWISVLITEVPLVEVLIRESSLQTTTWRLQHTKSPKNLKKLTLESLSRVSKFPPTPELWRQLWEKATGVRGSILYTVNGSSTSAFTMTNWYSSYNRVRLAHSSSIPFILPSLNKLKGKYGPPSHMWIWKTHWYLQLLDQPHSLSSQVVHGRHTIVQLSSHSLRPSPPTKRGLYYI